MISRLDFTIPRLENFLCHANSKRVPISNLRRMWQRKESNWLRLSFAVPKIQRDSDPAAPTSFRLRDTYILTFTTVDTEGMTLQLEKS